MLQFYYSGAPNPTKVALLLEELGLEYESIPVDTRKGEQHAPAFAKLNPNHKVPVIVDDGVVVFDSNAILLYLAEKHGQFMTKDPADRPEMLSWLFWQMGSAPYLGGGFGHFYAYAPEKWQYPIDRFAMEAKRQLDVLDRNLAERQFMTGADYTIADMAIWAWYGQLVLGRLYDAAEFLDVTSYKHVTRWANEIDARPQVQRGRMVNRSFGDPAMQLRERHDASDFETRTQDKLEPTE